ncbi:MAG: xanthine dehydrogenase family protein subunit M [Rhodospirillaceae bacterium]|nr:xanthine dehydrogenase family protein subunit M [Rhodospirillales bacterium]MBT3904789.1 xanthine dehydrogenase family protein subunit M [Rhodospirillaceae bacterium]MBT4700519.1 xanthine dehydrogenase family protein subunit M [Rhodospirillaceae bacterium]MBT5033552.1 xanthine dehydrogenase family protein subunit M [Rhodospirillaceae bacterium]MBT6219435.1 xanthine dehydrogenase family protein subunit M [Rhodospirillaceae bacterium]
MKYEAPETVEAAVGLLAAGTQGAKIFAGGTDLLVQMREDLIEPEVLIDIKKIAEVRAITVGSDDIKIGAAVTGAELGEHAEVNALWPGVVEAMELIGSDQVQGRATMGGNLCNASPAADSVPALIAAAAKAVIAGSGGTREVPVEEIVTGPGQTSLGPDEFVVQIILPKPPTRAGDAYLRFIPRTEMDIAVVGAGVSLSLNDDGTCAAVRMALGAVAPTVVLVEAASDILVGKNLDDAVLDALASAASGVCNPIDDKRGTIEFRTKVAGVLARRVTTIAWQRAEKS